MLGLAGLLSMLSPTPLPIARMQERLRPNPLAPRLPDQTAHAQVQAARLGGELRPDLSGLAGSETAWAGSGAAVAGVRIAQDVSSSGVPQPPGMFVPGDPGADGQPLLHRDFHSGPTGVPHRWGGNTRTVNTGAQHVLPFTLLPPTARTPAPRDIAAVRSGSKSDPEPPAAHDPLYALWSD